MPLVLGETGNKKLSKRDPQADLFLLREKGFIHEGLLNYLSLLGWSIAADRDVFSLDELVAAFELFLTVFELLFDDLDGLVILRLDRFKLRLAAVIGYSELEPFVTIDFIEHFFSDLDTLLHALGRC